MRNSKAHPVYDIEFFKYYGLLKARVSQLRNFYSIGRAGMHKYNNMDHSIISGFLAVRNYLRLPGSPYALRDINVDADYQEGFQ